jgi:hypothetical protein
MSSNPTQEVLPRRPQRRVLRWFGAAMLVIAAGVGGWFLWHYHPPADPVAIYQGVTYGCDRLPDTPESGGIMHWVRADLKVPGVSLYITPEDPDARSRGWEYKLKYTTTAVSEAHLAAAVNGTLFRSNSWYIRMPGDDATAIETIVAEHVVNHVNKDCYLMWWDDHLLAHLEVYKPPGIEALRGAKWGIAGQQVVLDQCRSGR